MISLGHPWPDLAARRKEFFNKLLNAQFYFVAAAKTRGVDRRGALWKFC